MQTTNAAAPILSRQNTRWGLALQPLKDAMRRCLPVDAGYACEAHVVGGAYNVPAGGGGV